MTCMLQFLNKNNLIKEIRQICQSHNNLLSIMIIHYQFWYRKVTLMFVQWLSWKFNLFGVWLCPGHSALIGTLIAPLMLLGGPLVLRAAAVTGGVVGALSLTAACAPDGKFLSWGGPLAIGLGGVCMACLGMCLLFSCNTCSVGTLWASCLYNY